MTRRVLVYLAILYLNQVSAQPEHISEKRDAWQFTIGAAAIASPLFDGSETYGFSLFPDLRVKYGQKFFASIPDGMGYNFSKNKSWRYGPIIKLRFSRKEDGSDSPFHITGDTNALKGLGNVSSAGEVGGFLGYETRFLKYKFELRQGFGGHEGLISDLAAHYKGRTRGLIYSFGPNIQYATEDYIETYFGVNPQQSLNTGLSEYAPSGGLTKIGVSGLILKPINQKIMMTVFGGYKRLLSEVSQSPIIKSKGSPDQFTVGLGFGYKL